jgi:hypothetical protein
MGSGQVVFPQISTMAPLCRESLSGTQFDLNCGQDSPKLGSLQLWSSEAGNGERGQAGMA